MNTGAIAVVTLTSFSKTAPAHHACQTIELLQHETMKFIGSDLWTPNSSDLNPANYHIWGVLQDCVYQTPIQDVADLRQCWVDS